jgi:hypothetical protein
LVAKVAESWESSHPFAPRQGWQAAFKRWYYSTPLGLAEAWREQAFVVESVERLRPFFDATGKDAEEELKAVESNIRDERSNKPLVVLTTWEPRLTLQRTYVQALRTRALMARYAMRVARFRNRTGKLPSTLAEAAAAEPTPTSLAPPESLGLKYSAPGNDSFSISADVPTYSRTSHIYTASVQFSKPRVSGR